MIGISTAYYTSRAKNWNDLLKKIHNLGFDTVELNPEIPEEWINDICSSINQGDIKIVAVHNFFPKLKNLPEGRSLISAYNFASDDENEIKLAIEYTMRTIDYAEMFNAKIVIVHAGDIPQQHTGSYLHKLAMDFGVNSDMVKLVREKVLSERSEKQHIYFENTKRTLEKIIEYAELKKITIGLENRLYAHEIPNVEELKELFTEFNSPYLGYWHDTGHAEILARMRIINSNMEYLEQLNKYLVGFHLHDVTHVIDHYAPGTKEIDFSIFKPYYIGRYLILEPHSRATDSEVINSKSYILNILNS